MQEETRSFELAGLTQIEIRIYAWMARNGIFLTRMALGVVFLWFGLLKLIPDVTPIDALAERTLSIVTLHHLSGPTCLHILAAWECTIGLGLILGRFLRVVLLLLFLQLPGTFLPLILLTTETWKHLPYFPTFEGQYIIKNLVLLAAGIMVGSSIRGGRMIAHPGVAQKAERVERAVEEARAE